MEIRLNASKEAAYTLYITLLNPLLDKNKLTEQEINVLSKMLYIDNMYSHLTKENRDIIIFNKITKSKIKDSLSISSNSYENVLSKLRKKKIISNKSLLFKQPNLKDELSINFIIKIK